MKIQPAVVLSLLPLAMLSGCCNMKVREPKVVAVSEVINLVKGEIRQFYAQVPPSVKKKAPDNAICKDPSGYTEFKISPTKAKLTLKTVMGRENDPSWGLKSPIGVLSIDPSYSGAYSTAASQTFELDVDVLKLNKAANKGDHPQTSEFKPEDHPLAAAILGMAQGYLDADHTREPCVQGTDLKATLTFDVVDKTSLGLGIQILIFKLGDKETITNESHQTLEFDFSLAGTSAAFF